jgi:hypothetical protein
MTLSFFWQLLLYGWFASEILVGVVTRTKHNSGKVHDRGSLLILWIVIAASVTACQWISESHAPNMFGGAHALKTAGVIVMLAGLAIRSQAGMVPPATHAYSTSASVGRRYFFPVACDNQCV